MADTVTGSVRAQLKGIVTPDTGWYLNKSREAILALDAYFGPGTALDLVDRVGLVYIALTASTPLVVDLLTALVHPVTSATVTMARIRALAISVESTTDAASVTLAADPTNGFTNLISTGGMKLLSATTKNRAGTLVVAPNTTGYVLSGTNKRLLLTPSAHANTVRILALGASV
jgi:hypothetical protein